MAQTRSPKVSGNRKAAPASLAGSVSVFKQNSPTNPTTDRAEIAKRWQVEAYRHINICGEARYAALLFASLASRAEIGISEPQGLRRKAVWVAIEKAASEFAALAEIAPTVRERTKLIRDYMLHYIVAGECYLIARNPVPGDPTYVENARPEPLWEIVAVTELRRTGSLWEVRHENGNYIPLRDEDPIIRMWSPDPEKRMEAWSPFRSMLPTLQEIEWETRHIFTQVRSRLISSGVWFLPDNLTFPRPPASAVQGGEEVINEMNESELLMASLAAASMELLDADEVAFPTIVMANPEALETVDQSKLIKFWSEIDDKVMHMRSDAIRRFALGMELPPEQILGSSGIAVTGGGGSAGSVNHWGVWANEEQTIKAHVEPALDTFVSTITTAFLRVVVEGTKYVVAYDTSSLRLRQDRSKESMEMYQMGVLKAEVMVRENGFDPETDMMDDAEHRVWLLNRLAGGSATPEQVQAALLLLGLPLPVQSLPTSGGEEDAAPGQPGRNEPPSLKDHPRQGPPEEQHDHSPAPFGPLQASSEVLVLRALEKMGNRLLNNRTRGKDKDKNTPLHLAYLVATPTTDVERESFDFSLAPQVLSGLPAREFDRVVRSLGDFCVSLVANQRPYRREALVEALEAAA